MMYHDKITVGLHVPNPHPDFNFNFSLIPIPSFHYLADGLGLVVGTQPSDVIYCALPLYHTNGGILAVGHVIFRGSTVVLRKKFSASQFWNDCITYGCTVSSAVANVDLPPPPPLLALLLSPLRSIYLHNYI